MYAALVHLFSFVFNFCGVGFICLWLPCSGYDKPTGQILPAVEQHTECSSRPSQRKGQAQKRLQKEQRQGRRQTCSGPIVTHRSGTKGKEVNTRPCQLYFRIVGLLVNTFWFFIFCLCAILFIFPRVLFGGIGEFHEVAKQV